MGLTIINTKPRNIGAVADFYKAGPDVMLALAMVCFAGIAAVVTVFTFASPTLHHCSADFYFFCEIFYQQRLGKKLID